MLHAVEHLGGDDDGAIIFPTGRDDSFLNDRHLGDVGLDAGILMHPEVWVTSGHVGSFSDPLVECGTCHRRFRLDELKGAEDLSATELQDQAIVEKLGLVCPVDQGPLSPLRRFNLMFQTHMGPVEDEGSVIYLRPETAQGSYVNFKSVQTSSRKKVPFGIAQIGKSFRNEISPGNFVFRMREFEQMEMQYFVRPGEAAAASFDEWLPARRAWYERYGVTPERLRLREHAEDIPPLVEHATDRLRRRHGMRPPRISADAMDVLSAYAWPGNVRELLNIVERLAILVPGPEVQPGDVLALLPRSRAPRGDGPVYANEDERSLRDRLDDFEKTLITGALDASSGNVADAGRLLQTDRANLYRRMKRLGLRE